MGKYKLKETVTLSKGEGFSDYEQSWQDGDKLYLYDYIEDGTSGYDIGPNMYTMMVDQYGSIKLIPFKFNGDGVLENSENTALISAKVDRFRSKLDVYAKYGIDTPKRSFLIHGPAGTGKSTTISHVCKKYSGAESSDTAVLIWPSARINANAVKSVIKKLKYRPNVKFFYLIIEDLGGVEVRATELASDPDLLSLLDNIESIFTKPTFVFATTNFPEVFLGNLTNRPQRFDEKLEVGYPSGESRAQLAKFFLKEEATQEFLNEIAKSMYKELTPAHIKEVVVRAAIEEVPLMESLKWVKRDIEDFHKAFSKQQKVGL